MFLFTNGKLVIVMQKVDILIVLITFFNMRNKYNRVLYFETGRVLKYFEFSCMIKFLSLI